MVGLTFEGAYAYDRRKKCIHGVWACVTPPPGVVHIDFEVRAFVQEFEIDDPGAIERLLAHCLNRPNTKSSDIDDIRRALRGARDPASYNDILDKHLEELANKSHINATKGRGKGGKGKGWR